MGSLLEPYLKIGVTLAILQSLGTEADLNERLQNMDLLGKVL